MSCAGCESCPFTEDNQDHSVVDLPYELHITVSATSDIEKFKNDCAALGVKPILIDMQRKDGASMLDLMTSSTVKGTYADAMNQLLRLSAIFTIHGYNVLRRKIETVPWHPEAAIMRDGQYFECHLAVKSPQTGRDRLLAIARGYGAHLSRNAFKALAGDYSITMMTLRSREDRETFEEKVSHLRLTLLRNGYAVDKTITEFAIFDDKQDHDKAWISPV